MMLKLLTLIVAVASATAIKVQYENYKVFRMNPLNKEQEQILTSLEESSEKYSFWKSPSHNHPTDLMVAPEKLNEFFHTMNATGIRYKTYIDDVETLIRNENCSFKTDSLFDWTSYHTLEEIYQWLDTLERNHPNIVKVIIGGRSYEGRDIKGIKLSFGRNNPGIFIEGGIHACEWISPATVTYLINEFLTSKDSAVRKLAESHDWYIFPSVNPDGYVYTHTTDRLWRKTRSKTANGCYGVDGNRNWDNMWMKIGASKNGCENIYAGSAAFSEIEMKSMSEFITSIGDKLFAYISFHSYSQMLLLPYGHTKEHLDNYDEIYLIGSKTVEAIAKRYGTQYTLGTFYETLYPGSGISIDWVKNTLKLPLVLLFELRDQGKYGFVLPPDQIIPNSQEILDGLLVLFGEAKKHGYE